MSATQVCCAALGRPWTFDGPTPAIVNRSPPPRFLPASNGSVQRVPSLPDLCQNGADSPGKCVCVSVLLLSSTLSVLHVHSSTPVANCLPLRRRQIAADSFNSE
ncbi:unnamed protein product [Soboliphyme baturini]|uniref:Uncharacterized protein n=1 Tax=Soboliphyme baturini TaxID=241478 RepID=A0A183IS61_9BILA|nr:unnamed protein product [Soboliphyme baturini]